MARCIAIQFEGEESQLGFVKVEREKLYGKKQRVVVDEAGRPCSSAWLTADGSALVPQGGTAHVWVDDQWRACESDARKAVDEEGRPLEVRPSTLGVPQEAKRVSADRVLDHVTTGIYQLDPAALGPKLAAALAEGGIIEIPFRYRDGLDEDALFVIKNDEGIFALVSRDARFEMLSRAELPIAVEPGADDGDELSEDLDFSMM